MKLLTTPLEKAERRHESVQARLEEAKAKLTPELDFDENLATRRLIRDLEDEAAAAAEAVTFQRAQADLAVKAAAKNKASAIVEACRREAEREVPGRLDKIMRLQAQIEPELAFLREHLQRSEEANKLAREHGLPPVIDGETLARKTPARTEPARFENREQWIGEKMDRPVQLRIHADGKTASSPYGTYHLKKVRVQTSPEREVPASMPERLATVVKLVDLAGAPIWPPRS